MPLAAAAGLVGNVVGGLFGSSAADKAAKAQQTAATQAANVAQQNQNLSTNYQTGVADLQKSLLNPYGTVGLGTLNSLGSLLQPGGQLTQGYGSFEAPTGVTEQNDPGYQFRLSQGLNALQNSAAARGGLLSSGTAKAINDYAQNSASNEYGNVYNRALQGYLTNFNTFNTNQNNLYNRLMGVSGLGLSAGSTLGGLLQSGAGNIAGINNAASQQIGQDIQNAGAARASGYIGANNAWNNALGGITNSLGGFALNNPWSNPRSTMVGVDEGALPGTWDYGQPG